MGLPGKPYGLRFFPARLLCRSGVAKNGLWAPSSVNATVVGNPFRNQQIRRLSCSSLPPTQEASTPCHGTGLKGAGTAWWTMLS